MRVCVCVDAMEVKLCMYAMAKIKDTIIVVVVVVAGDGARAGFSLIGFGLESEVKL